MTWGSDGRRLNVARGKYTRHLRSLSDESVMSIKKIPEYSQAADGSSILVWRNLNTMGISSVNGFQRHGSQEPTRTRTDMSVPSPSRPYPENDHQNWSIVAIS
jgi:hypothetical protein